MIAHKETCRAASGFTQTSRIVCHGQGAGCLFRVNHLKDIPVDGFAEKEPLERRGPQGGDQFRPLAKQPLFESGKCVKRITHGDVAAELAFKRRNDKALHEEDMDRLSEPEVEPLGFHRRVARHRTTNVTQCSLEERGGPFHVKRWQGQMEEAHRLAISNALSRRFTVSPEAVLYAGRFSESAVLIVVDRRDRRRHDRHRDHPVRQIRRDLQIRHGRHDRPAHWRQVA